jgi:hypothetical protein
MFWTSIELLQFALVRFLPSYMAWVALWKFGMFR